MNRVVKVSRLYEKQKPEIQKLREEKRGERMRRRLAELAEFGVGRILVESPKGGT